MGVFGCLSDIPHDGFETSTRYNSKKQISTKYHACLFNFQKLFLFFVVVKNFACFNYIVPT